MISVTVNQVPLRLWAHLFALRLRLYVVDRLIAAGVWKVHTSEGSNRNG